MSGSGRTLLSDVRGVAVGFAAAIVLLTAFTGSAPLGSGPTSNSLVAADDALPAGDGVAADAKTTGVGPQWDVFNWGPGPRAAVPAAFAMDQVVDGRTEQKVFVSSGANDDVATADPVHNMAVSEDSATSFLTTKRNFPVGAANMTRLPDGTLMTVDFIPEWADDTRTSVNIRSWTSKDNGATWKLTKGLFTPPSPFAGTDRGLRVHRKPMILADGALVVPAYTYYAADRRRSSIFLQTTDGGRSWTQRSKIPSSIGTNEVGWTYTVDGKLIAALRTEGESPARLRVSFSSDDARTWSDAVPLLDPEGKQVVGIYPDVVLQPNGILLLSTGRPDNHLYVSYDGTGRRWDEDKPVFVRYPSETSNGRYDGSSGNTALINVGASRSIFIGDKCHVWGCKAYNEQYGVFASLVNALTPGAGKIDVTTQLLTKAGSVTGDFVEPDKTFPETRPEGAFDGSSRPRAAAVLHSDDPATAPSIVVKLDRVYSLDRIGLMLGSGQPADATVSLSVDGKAWSAPVITASGTRDHAMRYTTFDAQQAQYVKVTAPAGRDTAVTELELYSADVQTFENDPIYGIPRGFTDCKNTTTTDQELKGHRSDTSMRLWDKYLDDNATATKLTADVAHQRTTFQWATLDFRGPFVFNVKGHSGDTVTTPWQFRLVPAATGQPAQKLEVHNGSGWVSLGNLTTNIPINTWVPVTIDATTSQATVTINGQTFTATMPAQPTTTLAGMSFSTSDPIAYGMDFRIDDLTIARV